MSISSDIKFDTRLLDKLIKDIPKRVEQICEEGAVELAQRSAAIAPYKTGALRRSIKHIKVAEGHWRVEDGVHYGVIQELGDSKHRPRRFMARAIQAMATHWFEKIREAMLP